MFSFSLIGICVKEVTKIKKIFQNLAKSGIWVFVRDSFLLNLTNFPSWWTIKFKLSLNFKVTVASRLFSKLCLLIKFLLDQLQLKPCVNDVDTLFYKIWLKRCWSVDASPREGSHGPTPLVFTWWLCWLSLMKYFHMWQYVHVCKKKKSYIIS